MAEAVLTRPMLVIEDVPKTAASPDMEAMQTALMMRLAKGEIIEATFIRAMIDDSRARACVSTTVTISSNISLSSLPNALG